VKAMAKVYHSGAYSMRKIGGFFGAVRMTVNRAVKKGELIDVNERPNPVFLRVNVFHIH
jgi:hypothetical protein